MQIIVSLLIKIALSLATEKVFDAVIANILEQIKDRTTTKIDDAILNPVIDALRGK